jgi:hypothetical protein
MLEYPLDNISKGSIENALFMTLKSLQFKGGLPIFKTQRTDKPINGEVYLYNLASTYKICAYINGGERCITLT